MARTSKIITPDLVFRAERVLRYSSDHHERRLATQILRDYEKQELNRRVRIDPIFRPVED